VTTAATGDGVPELLAALDRHREAGRQGRSTAARLARAESQVWAILADRVRDRLSGPSTEGATATGEILRAVAEHELDPFAAADRLLERLAREG
jgi:putative protein kinase ArgK-like GTPase of G3E family